MSDFDRALAITFGQEGGQSNHKSDRGGVTNMGVTQDAYDTFCRRLKRPKKSVKTLTRAEAVEFYRLKHWEWPRVAELAWPFSMLAFDGGVNSGETRGIKWVQQGLGLKADGLIGPRTIAAAARAVEEGDGLSIFRAIEARGRFLANLCQKDHSQIAFVEGWWVRTLAIQAQALAGGEE